MFSHCYDESDESPGAAERTIERAERWRDRPPREFYESSPLSTGEWDGDPEDGEEEDEHE